MRKKLIKTSIYGFDDYNVVRMNHYCFSSNKNSFGLPYYFSVLNGTYIPNQDLSVKIVENKNTCYYDDPDLLTSSPIYENNIRLLNTANKLYVHPNCKLSRTMLAEKYKKSLDPWSADAVVVPELSLRSLRIEKMALFVHEQDKVIVTIILDNTDAVNNIQGISEGDKLCDWITCQPYIDGYSRPYNISAVTDAEFMYQGEVLFVPNHQSHILEALTHNLPADKFVYEESVQESLSNQSNQLTLDSLIAIKDMLESSDTDTISAGLKSLSMMDYAHYPNSIKYFFKQVSYYKYRYNKAMQATSVKFMLKHIFGQNYHRGLRGFCDFDSTIYLEDYNLFCQLRQYFEKIKQEDMPSYMRYVAFMTKHDDVLSPNLKEKSTVSTPQDELS